MKKEPDRKIIGLYLIIGFTLFFGIIGQFIWQKLRSDEEDIYVMYSNESIQGLSVGSPVVFQGVEVGTVTRIRLVDDKDNLIFLIPVYARINPIKNMEENSVWRKIWNKNDLLSSLIQRGLRARLATQSYLTGQLRIELVILPNSIIEEIPRQDGNRYPQIPTVLSKSEELVKGLNKLELKEAITQFNHITYFTVIISKR